MPDSRPAAGSRLVLHDSKPIPRSVRRPVSTSASEPAQPKILYDDGSEQVLVLGNCVVVIIRSKLSLGAVATIESAFEEIANRKEWIGYFSHVVHGKTMDSVAQQRMANLVGRYTKQISAAAIVYRGAGFRATAVRSVITAIHWASRATHPMKVFDDIGSALLWLKRQPHAESIDLNSLGSVVRAAGE